MQSFDNVIFLFVAGRMDSTTEKCSNPRGGSDAELHDDS